MKKRNILIIAFIGIVSFGLIIFVLVGVIRNSSNSINSSTTTSSSKSTTTTSLAPLFNLTGNWTGSYTTFYPKACALDGNWTATIVDQNGKLTGTFTSDLGDGGNITGNVSGSQFNFEVSGGNGITFNGNIVNTSVGGNFTGPACTNISYRSGAFSGNKK